MPTNEERQEAVKRLREDARLGALPFIDFLGAVAYDVAVERDERGVLNRLADLIEPEPIVDRDALLMLADDLAASYPWDIDQAISTMEEMAQLIREACGMHEEQ